MPDKKVQSRNFHRTYKSFLTEYDKYKRVCNELERKDWLSMPLDLETLTSNISVNLISKCFRYNDFLKLNHRNQFKCILHMNECKNCYIDNNDNVIMMYMKLLLTVPNKTKKTKKKRIILMPKPQVELQESDTELSDVIVIEKPKIRPRPRKIKITRYTNTDDNLYDESDN